MCKKKLNKLQPLIDNYIRERNLLKIFEFKKLKQVGSYSKVISGLDQETTAQKLEVIFDCKIEIREPENYISPEKLRGLEKRNNFRKTCRFNLHEYKMDRRFEERIKQTSYAERYFSDQEDYDP